MVYVDTQNHLINLHLVIYLTLLSKANYIWGLNQTSHHEEAITTQVLKIQSSNIAQSSINQASEDLKIFLNEKKKSAYQSQQWWQ